MKRLFKIHFFSLLILFPFFATGQSLYDDARALVAARNYLEANGYSPQDTASAQAFARIMAILYTYDNPMASGEFSQSKLAKIPNRYRTNPNIPELLPLDSLYNMPDSFQTLFTRELQCQADTMQLAPRQRMIDLLRGDYGSSPAEYLSVSKALREYSVPPTDTKLALGQVAKESNKNVVNGIVNSQAVIEGLFNFILKRAQEEVVITFLERFLTEDLPQYEELFPLVVEQFSAHEFSYSHSFIERVRDAFYEDLQLFSVRFPNILLTDERFAAVQEDPLIYNLLAVYSIIGMTQNKAEIDEILPITFRNLYESYSQKQKKLNLTVVENAPGDSEDYLELIRLSDTCIHQIENIYKLLEDAEAKIANEIAEITREDIPTPDFAVALAPSYDLEMIMGSDSAFRLNLLPGMLGGFLDPAYVLGFTEVSAYDKFFSDDLSPEYLKAAGLELARNLHGARFADFTIDQLLRAWVEDMTTYRLEFDKWKRSLFPELEMEKAFQELENGRVSLSNVIRATKTFWSDRNRLARSQPLAFDMLDTIISNDFDPELNINNIIKIETYGLKTFEKNREQYGDLSDEEKDILITILGKEAFLQESARKLLDVESRLIQLNDRIAADYSEPQTNNPIHQYLLDKQSIHPYTEILARADVLKDELNALKRQLDTLDRKHAKSEVQIMENAQPLLGLTEALTHLMYCLRTGDDEQKWITKVQLDSILRDPDLKNAFLGLLYQRLCQVQNVPRLSPEGLANIVKLTVADLPWVLYPEKADTSKLDLSFYYPAAFLVNTLQRVLQIPLIVDPGSPGEVLPLAKTHPSLNNVPDISGKVLDLIYYLNARDHRHAVSSAIRLFLLLENLPVDTTIRHFLQQYGYFIADLVDADTSYEVESLLNGIADPPGSSRLKRSKGLTVGLNAYLGGSVGRETWRTGAAATGPREDFNSIAPTMPIGITFSGLIGNTGNPPSFSIFLSFLDLGSMLSFRGDNSAFGENKITFKNMFKPSLQVHYNIRKTPFYVGLGGQLGPHFTELNGNEMSVRTTRFFLNFGVDVPVKTFYVR